MNLYNLHTDPEQLAHFDEQYKMPGNAWSIYIRSLKEKDKKTEEWIWPWLVKDAESAYVYALWKHKRFPEGEEAILWDAQWARKYATNVLKARWPEAEDMIYTDRSEGLIYDHEFGL